MIPVVILHFDASQHLVPFPATIGSHCFQVIPVQFFQILFRLLKADEGRSYAYVHRLSPLGGESDDAACMLVIGFQFSRTDIAVADCCRKGKRLVEHQYKVVLKVLGHAAAILGGIADNLVLFRNHFQVRTSVQRIHHYIRVLTLGESEAEDGSTAGRCKLGGYVMVCQVYLIIIRFGYLRLVRKPTGTLIFIEYHLPADGHNGKLSVVINPRTGLVCLFEASYLVGIVRICPSVSHPSGLRHPEVHSPGQGDGRIRVSRRQGMLGLCADQRTDIVHRFGHSFSQSTERNTQHTY